MSEHTPESRHEALLERLLRTSGRGPTASADAKARVYAIVHARWQATLRKEPGQVGTPRGTRDTAPPRSTGKYWGLTRTLALAASVAAVAVIAYRLQPPQENPVLPFASIAKVEGNVAVLHSGDVRPVAARPSAGVRVGDTVTTDAGAKLALRLENGYTLRINSSSELEILAADTVDLSAGTVYFDSNSLDLDGAFRIESALGSVRHAGTQFEASLVAAGLRIRVREGTVTFNDSSGELIAGAGEQIHIESSGAPLRTSIAADDPAWTWVEDLATLPVDSEYPLPSVLTWISRETGRDVRFADAAVEARAQTVVLYDLEDLTPQETLAVLRSTTAFEYRHTDSGLLVAGSDR
jgi:ferric-dicitrate binding protein FerR (iron transport regulator)